jgi:hypothetical protein
VSPETIIIRLIVGVLFLSMLLLFLLAVISGKNYLLFLGMAACVAMMLIVSLSDSIKSIQKDWSKKTEIPNIIAGWERSYFPHKNANVKILTVSKETLREFAGYAYDKDDAGLRDIDLQNKKLPEGFPPGGILRARDRQLVFCFQAGYPPSRLGGPWNSLPVFIRWESADKVSFYTYSNAR